MGQTGNSNLILCTPGSHFNKSNQNIRNIHVPTSGANTHCHLIKKASDTRQKQNLQYSRDEKKVTICQMSPHHLSQKLTVRQKTCGWWNDVWLAPLDFASYLHPKIPMKTQKTMKPYLTGKKKNRTFGKRRTSVTIKLGEACCLPPCTMPLKAFQADHSSPRKIILVLKPHENEQKCAKLNNRDNQMQYNKYMITWFRQLRRQFQIKETSRRQGEKIREYY